MVLRFIALTMLLLPQVMALQALEVASQRFLVRRTADSLFERSICSRHLLTPCRYLHTAPILQGVYAQPTEDAIFKHLMSDKEVRNSFL